MLAKVKLLDKLWPIVWPLIKQASDLTELETGEDILADLKAQKRSLIIVGDGVAVVRAMGDIFEINYVAGKNAKEWWPRMSNAIDIAAKKMGCKKIVAFARPAWKRIAPEFESRDTRMYIKEVA